MNILERWERILKFYDMGVLDNISNYLIYDKFPQKVLEVAYIGGSLEETYPWVKSRRWVTLS
jgi:hypothetical protein